MGAFKIQTQEQLNWCWAAVGVSIDKYFSPQSTRTQCQLAGQVLGGDCCSNSDSCDLAEGLEDALNVTGTLKQARGGIALDFDDIRQEIEAGRPVCARIGWQPDETRGHFVVIRGYSVSSAGEPWVDIADPYYLDSTIPYDEFVNAYLDAGVWTDTFLVQHP